MMMTRCDIISVSYTSERKSFVSVVAALLDGRNDNADISPDRRCHGRRLSDPRGELSVENTQLEAHTLALFAAMTRTLILIAALGALFWWAGSNPDPQQRTSWCGESGYFSKC